MRGPKREGTSGWKKKTSYFSFFGVELNVVVVEQQSMLSFTN